MIAGSRVLAVIPARGGSKGVQRKNVRVLGGKPLIVWTLEASSGSKFIDRTIVSSDDEEVIAVTRAHGGEVPFVRSAELASDHAPTIEVVLDALERCPGHDWVVLLQPTSPLRTSADIDAAVTLCIELDAPACVSVCLAQESPYWMYTLGSRGELAPLLPSVQATRRQDLPAVYSLNGAVYVANRTWLRKHRSFLHPDTVAYVMPSERSVDIDTENDLLQLQIFLEK